VRHDATPVGAVLFTMTLALAHVSCDKAAAAY